MTAMPELVPLGAAPAQPASSTTAALSICRPRRERIPMIAQPGIHAPSSNARSTAAPWRGASRG
jgi:hypothetical protein